MTTRAVTIVLVAAAFVAPTPAGAATAWQPQREVLGPGNGASVQGLYRLPDGRAGMVADGSSLRLIDFAPDGTPAQASPDLPQGFWAGGVAESPVRASLVWSYKGVVHVSDRASGDAAFGAPEVVPVTSSSVQWITRPHANAAGDLVFGYTGYDADGVLVAHVVQRAAGATTWTDDAVFEDAGIAGVGVDDTGRLIAVVYADDAYWVTTATWSGDFSEPEWIGDTYDGVQQFVFDVNGPGDALVSWQTNVPDYAQDDDAYLVAWVDRSGAVEPAAPVPGAERNTENGTATLDDAGRATFAFSRSERANRSGVLFTVTRARGGSFSPAEAPFGLIRSSHGRFRIDADPAGNTVLATEINDGKFAIEAVRRTPQGGWGAPQDVVLPCPGGDWVELVGLIVHGEAATVLSRPPVPGAATVGASRVILSRELPSGATAGRVCGTPFFEPYSPITGPPAPTTPVAPTVGALVPPPRGATAPVHRTPKVRISSMRVLGRVTHGSRVVRVRVACPRGCKLKLQIRPRAGGRSLATASAFLTGKRARTLKIRIPKRAIGRWRRARSGSLRVVATASWQGLTSSRTSRTIRLARAKRR